MHAFTPTTHEPARFELHFRSVHGASCGCSFPCDAAGHVDIDALADRARLDYFYARTLIGYEFLAPAIEPGIPLH